MACICQHFILLECFLVKKGGDCARQLRSLTAADHCERRQSDLSFAERALSIVDKRNKPARIRSVQARLPAQLLRTLLDWASESAIENYLPHCRTFPTSFAAPGKGCTSYKARLINFDPALNDFESKPIKVAGAKELTPE